MANQSSALFAWTAALGLIPGLFAQVPQRPAPAGPSGTGVILGQIVDADANRGISGALVMLSPSAAPATGVAGGELTEARTPSINLQAAGQLRTLTTATGHFVFRDVPRGQFSLTATAPTHLLGSYGQLRPLGPSQALTLGDGEKKGGVAIKLWQLGSIAGVVRDDRGEVMVGVGVECLRRVIAGGQKRYASQGASTSTDDRGIYRVGNLPPGDYACGITQNTTTTPASIAADDPTSAGRAGAPSPEAQRLTNSGGILSSSGMRLGGLIFSSGASAIRGASVPPPDANGRLMAFAPVFHPSASTPSQATAIALKAGEERFGVDLVMKLVPAVTVSGTVSAPAGQGSFLSLRLVPASGGDYASEGQAEYSRTVSDPAGAFAFLGVPAGQYVIKSRYYPRPAPGGNVAAALDEASLWTATPVTVGDKDLTNLSITMRPGIRATGRVEFSGTRAAPAAAEVARIGIRMQNAEGRTSSPISLDGRVAADGSFKTAGYSAGRYIANVLPNTVPAGWSVKSITYNGRDISVEPVELTDTDLSSIVVTFTDKSTTLSGTATGPSGAVAGAEILVFPADSMAWKEIGVVGRRSRVERVAESGAFSIAGLPAGDYFVAALAGSQPGDRQDPALLSAVIGTATRVTLQDGGSATVQVAVKR